jgi:hypothetical protein
MKRDCASPNIISILCTAMALAFLLTISGLFLCSPAAAQQATSAPVLAWSNADALRVDGTSTRAMYDVADVADMASKLVQGVLGTSSDSLASSGNTGVLDADLAAADLVVVFLGSQVCVMCQSNDRMAHTQCGGVSFLKCSHRFYREHWRAIKGLRCCYGLILKGRSKAAPHPCSLTLQMDASVLRRAAQLPELQPLVQLLDAAKSSLAMPFLRQVGG